MSWLSTYLGEVYWLTEWKSPGVGWPSVGTVRNRSCSWAHLWLAVSWPLSASPGLFLFRGGKPSPCSPSSQSSPKKRTVSPNSDLGHVYPSANRGCQESRRLWLVRPGLWLHPLERTDASTRSRYTYCGSPAGDWGMGHFPKKNRAGVIRGRGAWILGRHKQQISIPLFSFDFSALVTQGKNCMLPSRAG